MRTIRHLPIACLTLLGLVEALRADNWPRFRGPNGSGIGALSNVPAVWTPKDYNWKIRLPGMGHSSPVVWGKRIFVTCGDEKTGERILQCVRADDGKSLWQRKFPGEPHRKHRDNSFASATPAVDERCAYVCWGGAKEYLVVAVDHDGKEIWRRDLGPFKAGHGFGVSPIVHESVLIVPNDQNGPSSILGLNRLNGKTLWTVPRTSKASYSTPCIYQPKSGPAQLIVTNYEHGVTAIDPKNGKVLWEMDVFNKDHVESAIASPIVTGDLVLATCGWMGVRQEVVAVQPPATLGKLKPKRLYDVHRSAPLCTTPLVKDDLLFLWDDYGIVTCADVKTGKVHWRERVNGAYYSSPVCDGERIFNVSRKGDVIVLRASKAFKVLARNPLGEGTHGTPAMANGCLYLRTFSHLIAIGGSGSK